jgi:hypothetical protein
MNNLEERCLNLVHELCKENNGNLAYVPDEDVESLLQSLTEDNIEEVASELSYLAYWFN